MMSKLIELSHTIEEGLITYKGIPAPLICDFLSRKDSESHYADGVSFCINQIDMPANTGTYIDSPFHRYENGKDLSQLDLNCVTELEGVIVRTNDHAIDATHFQNLDLTGKAVLIQTGWSRHWKTDAYFENHPFLTKDAAEYLKQQGVALAGIDSLNIDDIEDLERPVHSILLAAEIPIVEHLCNLESLPISGFRFNSAPVKIKGFGTFPVRAYAVVET